MKKTLLTQVVILSAVLLTGCEYSNAQAPEDTPNLAYTAKNDEGSPKSFSVNVSERFIIRKAQEDQYLIHPILSPLADGGLLLKASRDSDIIDEEHFIWSSRDGGQSWESVPDWPLSDGNGSHIRQVHTVLPDGRSIVVPAYIISTGNPNEYILPAWVENGEGFTETEPVPFEIPYGRAADYQNPAEWPTMRRGATEPDKPEFLTESGTPTKIMQDFRAKFGKRWLVGLVSMLYPLDDKTLLAFAYIATKTEDTSERARFMTICLESHDEGKSWALRSVPGPWDPALEKKNSRKKPLDGFCEPSVTRLRNGNHIAIMRLGAWQRLYSAVSTDDCRTWSKPKQISVFGILPTVVTLPDGTLALCTGRPDNTLSFSFDNGYTWAWTVTLLDQTLPEYPSTRNNAMIQVSPGRLLYVYDYGYRRPDEGVEVPHAIEGVFVDVSTER